MGINIVRSLLSRSTGALSPAPGQTGESDRTSEGGFSKIVSRVKSSFALSPTCNKSLVLTGNNNDAVSNRHTSPLYVGHARVDSRVAGQFQIGK